jgi:predicted NBD/HSP70 family sugar kinase
VTSKPLKSTRVNTHEADLALGATYLRQATLAPPAMRLANLTRLLQEIRSENVISRSDLAQRTGLAAPTVHRLISDLVKLDLVTEEAPIVDEGRVGRPSWKYRISDRAAVLVGIDIGNETTRVVLASVSGDVIGRTSTLTRTIHRDLVGGLVRMIEQLRADALRPEIPIAAIGIGVAAAVDPTTGVLSRPPRYKDWEGLPLAETLRARLDCRVEVEQDDHLASLAEGSEIGTAPGANSILVIEIGKGVGVGFTIGREPVKGARGRFGRIADWPIREVHGVKLPGTTVSDCLSSDGLVAQYLARGGTAKVNDAASVATAARRGDSVATAVLSWAGRELADVIVRLKLLCDPEVVVFGGGLSNSFDLLQPHIEIALSGVSAPVLPSKLGSDAVLMGALLLAQSTIDSWFQERLSRS